MDVKCEQKLRALYVIFKFSEQYFSNIPRVVPQIIKYTH